jgi:PAS domain-containing protein
MLKSPQASHGALTEGRLQAPRALPSFSAAELSTRSLFDAATEPALILDGESTRILEANPSAAELLKVARAELTGTAFLSLFEPASATTLRQSLAQARATGTATARRARIADQGEELLISLTEVQLTSDTSALLVRLSPTTTSRPATHQPSRVLEAIDASTSAFVVTDLEWRLQYANPAFVKLLEAGESADLLGESLEQWLLWSQTDEAHLEQQLRQRRASSEFTARLRCGPYRIRTVEVLAIAVATGDLPCWAFTIEEIQAPGALN